MGTNITGIGNANAIGFKSRVTGGTYFPPELKDALVGVWSAYGKSNDSTDRNIIKNKIKDRGGDFVISNAAFKLNSGFGKYETELSNTRIWTQSKETTSSPFSSNYNGLSGWIVFANTELTNSVDMPSFKIQVKGLLEGQELIYRYYDSTGQTNVYSMTKDGKYTLPADVRTAKPLTSNTSGFQIVKNETNTITITQIPSFEGAFVTDGIDDLITSTKTVQEMGITDEITVVSMIHKISSDNNWTNLIGELKEDHTFVANRATNTDKTGIYGYTYNYVGDAIVINNILGDKNDYIVRTSTSLGLDNKYYVTGFRSAGIIQNISQIAWYWTFIANRVLTEDEINLVIEKYNLDRPGEIVKPQVYYNIKKQKISNDNHSAFDDKLIDYSGNGYDAKLYNFGWKEDSGIGKYETDFTDWKKSFKVTSFDSESIKFTSDVSWVLLYHPSSIGEDIPSFKVRIKLYGKGTLYYNYITQEGKYTNVAVKSEIFETPICYNTKYTGEKGVNVGFTLGVTSGECSGTITQIPEYENALVLDGVDDYGKVTGLPILKDYTVAADYIRTFAKESAQDSPILSKSKVASSGAFLFNYLNADSITSSYSFGTNNILKEINDSERKIYYLSKYASDGHNVNAGSAVDYDTMWLGTYRDNISNFFTGALYFAMLFPYSLSEFLLERQIKKARAGTLYSNQVKFRPIIPEDENITRIDYFVVDSGIWKVIKPGDYVDVGARIVLNVYTKLPYKIAGASSTAFTGMTVGPSTALNIWDVKGYIKDKTPQKIKLTLAVNEDIIQWNPTISANIPDSYDAVTEWFANGWETKIAVGDWIKKSDRIFFKLKLKEPLHEIGKVTFGGSECQATKASNWSESNNLWEIVTYSSVGDLSQVFNVQVDEYIRYEDIVQPYPSIINLVSIDKTHFYTYGDKLKVGDVILYNSYKNLLKGLYSLNGQLKYNGVYIYDIDGRITVAKEMVFSWTVSPTWLLDNNEPKVILSPSRLRMPNSSYKILGHIPDISGHGNHGKINNFAYALNSGANGYPYDYNNSSFWADSSSAKVVSGELVEYFAVKNSTGFSNITSGVYKGKIKVTGVTKAISENKISRLRIYSNSTTDNELIDITQDGNYNIDIKGVDDANRVFFHAIPSNPNDTAVVRLTEPIYIEQVGNYEGSICFDGVDDYMDIPSLSIGGKQVLMKTNWLKSPTLLYDQRASGSFAILTTKEDDATNPRIAYQARNQDGKTYIDGIENNYIETYSLKGITHNITVTNPSAGSGVVPVIGANTGKSSSFAKMALYDFMLFDEVSTNEEIKQLNDIVGIEGGYVQKPPYYWDAYGKTNLDADKATIQQRGVAVGNYDLTNTNFAYDKMSGFGGYTLGKFTNSWSLSNNSNSISIVARNPYDITLKKLGGNSDWEFETTELKLTSNPVSVKFKSDKNIRFTCDYHYYTVGGNSEGAPLGITSKDLIANEDTIITISPISQENIDKYNIDINRGYYLIYFQLSPTLAVNEEVTIEMLPLYPNGLVYDGVDDYSENISIPAFTDYTYIFKRTLLNKKYNSASVFKGSDQQSGGGAFICDYNSVKPELMIQGYSFGAGLYANSLNTNDIVYGTKNSVNGQAITSGNNADTEGLTIGKWRAYKQMVFYKLMLYPRTTDMLTINMIKNMMAEDGIIDIQGKLFTDKYTGDFNLDFNKDFLIGN